MRKKVRENEYNNYRGPQRIRKKQGKDNNNSELLSLLNISISGSTLVLNVVVVSFYAFFNSISVI
jgi:hypothetical protein